MHEELKRAVEAAKAHPERLEKNPGNYSTYRRFLATHGDALIAAVALADKCTEGLYWLSYDKGGAPHRCKELDAYRAATQERRGS